MKVHKLLGILCIFTYFTSFISYVLLNTVDFDRLTHW